MSLQTTIPAARHREINQALGAILQLRGELDKAERCGYDATADRAALDALEESLKAWKREYFPTMP